VTDDHPTPETLDRLLAAASTGEDSARVLAHLVDRYETCSRHVRGALARAGRPPGGPEAYDQAFAGSLARSAAGVVGIHAEHWPPSNEIELKETRCRRLSKSAVICRDLGGDTVDRHRRLDR
jgi:hypothetical protein